MTRPLVDGPLVGMGCMRLSTEHDRDDSRSIEVLHAALDAGVTLLDTAGPPICWCRKPLPGLGVVFIQRHRLDPTRCIYVGAGPQDPGFARRLGFQYREAGDFFATRAGQD